MKICTKTVELRAEFEPLPKDLFLEEKKTGQCASDPRSGLHTVIPVLLAQRPLGLILDMFSNEDW